MNLVYTVLIVNCVVIDVIVYEIYKILKAQL